MKRTPAVAAMLTLLLSAVCGAEPELCFSFEDEALPGVAGKAADAAGQVRELVPEKAGFPGGKDFSVSCFIRPSAKPGYQIVLSQAGMNPADRLWWIGYSPSLRRFDFLVRDADGKGQSQVFSRSVDSSSGWIHVAAACRDGKLAIRATGLEKAQLDTGSAAVENRGVRRGAMPLLLGGRRGEQPRGCFDGAVDELTLWSRGLSDRELDVLFRLGKSGKTFSEKEFDALLAQSEFKPVEPEHPVFGVFPEKRRSAKPGTIPAGECCLFPEQLANGDFTVELALTMNDPASCRWLFELGADGFRFDGAKKLLVNAGNHGAADFRNRPLGHRFEQAPRQLRLGLARRGAGLAVSLDGKEVWNGTFSRDTVGELALNVESGSVTVDGFSVRGALLKRDIVPVFPEGEAGSRFYRIPALAAGKDGTLHAFAEARRTSLGDVGEIDIAYRRSADGGKSWEPVRFLTRRHDQGFSSNNPSPAIDPVSGRLHLFYVEVPAKKWGQHDYRVLHTVSGDGGGNWSEPVDIAPMLPKEWGVFLPAPGHSLVLKHGKYAGRIVVPGWCNRPDKGTNFYQSTLILSDDGGRSFRAGGVAMEKSDECMLAELPDGALVMAIRPTASHREVRFFAVSRDGGESFEPACADPALRAVVCQNSILAGSDGSLNYLYPAGGSYAPDAMCRRAALTLRRKSPVAKEWSAPQPVYLGRSGYSDLAELPDGSLGILFEGGRKSDMGGIGFVRMPKGGF
ncbi:hypothetical protein C5Q97_09145 [Victivallales bacterium CCUG 44730]|nr:hypothetical protein C5Q97_09145 [Victivallales bacterium CCUG 44730]